MFDFQKPKIEIAEISEDKKYGKFVVEPLALYWLRSLSADSHVFRLCENRADGKYGLNRPLELRHRKGEGRSYYRGTEEKRFIEGSIMAIDVLSDRSYNGIKESVATAKNVGIRCHLYPDIWWAGDFYGDHRYDDL